MALTLTGNILSKISFCDKQCSNVNDNKIKSQIIQTIDSKYGIQIVTRDYNMINPNILRNVSYHQHILTPYTHGNPYMLYLTKIDNINCALFIDKKLKMAIRILKFIVLNIDLVMNCMKKILSLQVN